MKKHFPWITLTCCLPLAIPPLNAAPPDDKAIPMEPVLVTADKLTQPLEEVPASLSVVAGEQIQEAQITTMPDTALRTPNLFFSGHGGGGYSNVIFIRGIGAYLNDPAVSFNVDGVAMTNHGLFDPDLANVERIEVLRGPQGTLYGRNALGGVINVITRPPGTEQKMELEAGLEEHSGRRLRALLESPLGSTAGASLSLSKEDSEGYTVNLASGQRGEEKDETGGQLRLRWQPMPLWNVDAAVRHEEAHNAAFYGNPPTDLNNHAQNVELNADGWTDKRDTATSVQLRRKDDHGEFTAITAWNNWDNTIYLDGDYSNKEYLLISSPEQIDHLSQEFRYASQPTDSLQWLVGTHLFTERYSRYLDLAYGDDAVTDGLVPTPLSALYDLVFHTQGAALFGQGTWFINDRLDLTVGARLEWMERTLDREQWVEIGGAVVDGSSLDRNPSRQDQVVLPKATLTYAWQPEVSLYATVARGFRAGGFNLIYQDAADEGFAPEFSWNYEAGVKWNLPSHHARLQLSVFQIDLTDQQVEQLLPGFIMVTRNAGRSRSRGVELEGQWQPNREWRFDGAYGFTDARFLEFYDEVAGEDYAGKQVAKSPKHTVHLGATRSHELGNHTTLSTRVEFEGMGKLYWDNGNTLAQEFYPLANLFVTLSKDNWEWSLWGRNLLDETYDGYGFVDAAMGDRIFPGAPRVVGLTARVRY